MLLTLLILGLGLLPISKLYHISDIVMWVGGRTSMCSMHGVKLEHHKN